MRYLLPSILTFTIFNASAEPLSGRCIFTRVVSVTMDGTKTADNRIHQSMTITKGKTSKETLKATGMIRAANSKTWESVGRRPGWTMNAQQYLGDDGELLTVEAEDGAEFGTYNATLQSATPNWYANTMLGECTGAFSTKD